VTGDECMPLPYYANTIIEQGSMREGSKVAVTCIGGHRYPDGHIKKVIECSDGYWIPDVLPPCLSMQ